MDRRSTGWGGPDSIECVPRRRPPCTGPGRRRDGCATPARTRRTSTRTGPRSARTGWPRSGCSRAPPIRRISSTILTMMNGDTADPRWRPDSGPDPTLRSAPPGSGGPVKVVAIGIGSVIFGVELLRDIFRVPEFRGADLWLVDVDADALGRMTRLAGRLNDAAGWDATLRSTPDRREAPPRADFVVTSLAIDPVATWRADHALALSHGFASVLSENGGPGGLSHT